jgi:hypothetical protein
MHHLGDEARRCGTCVAGARRCFLWREGEQIPKKEVLCAFNRIPGVYWTIIEMDGMNHAFQRCDTGMPDECGSVDHVMAPEVIDEVSAWMGSRSSSE